MTPEQAQELLDAANRGETDGQRPVTVAASHAPLAEAAPALAHLVAGLHYEYAVQVLSEGEWHHEHENHGLVPREGAQWFDNYREAWQASTCWVDDDFPTRIVRRLATDPEVVE